MSAATDIFFDLVRDHAHRNAVVASPDTSVGDVVGLMTTGEATAVVVVDADRRPAGIVTEQDIVRITRAEPDPRDERGHRQEDRVDRRFPFARELEHPTVFVVVAENRAAARSEIALRFHRASSPFSK